jgi:hypothetical protein
MECLAVLELGRKVEGFDGGERGGGFGGGIDEGFKDFELFEHVAGVAALSGRGFWGGLVLGYFDGWGVRKLAAGAGEAKELGAPAGFLEGWLDVAGGEGLCGLAGTHGELELGLEAEGFFK